MPSTKIEFPSPNLIKNIYISIFIAFAIYLWFALFTFDFNDPSILSSVYPKNNSITNACGVAGSLIAGWLFWQFGVLAYIVPWFIVFERWVFFKSRSLKVSVFFSLLALFFVSTLAIHQAGLEFSIDENRLNAAGATGTLLSQVVTKYFGKIGPWIFIGSCFLAIISPFLLFLLSRLKAYKLSPAHRFRVKGSVLQRSLGALKKFREVAPLPLEETAAETPSLTHHPLIEEPLSGLAYRQPELTEDFQGPDNPRPAQQSQEPNESFLPPQQVFNTSLDGADKPQDDQEETRDTLVKTLENFGVKGKIINIQSGPVVAVYEFLPVAGTKQSKVIGLAEDLALALKVDSLLINPVSGKSALGIEVPNKDRQLVYFGDLLDSHEFQSTDNPMTYALGKSISGKTLCMDIAKMPHLLMAGATGSGKSVAVNAIICSVLMKAKPDQVRLILVDPKMLELSVYEEIPHLLLPVITDPFEAATSLKWAVSEMENRYKFMQQAKVRNIAGFNEYFSQLSSVDRADFCEMNNIDTMDSLPYILIVIDELADLMLTAPKDVETQIQRLAQKARASGIHLVLATQRPSVDIITGVIKANLPCRAAFQVVSKHDSRTILDRPGADKLLGKGDMLLQTPGHFKLQRAQSAFISDQEVNDLVRQLKQNAEPNYDATLMEWIEANNISSEGGGGGDEDSDDPKFSEARELAQTHGHISASFLQRHLKIGYNRAARIVESMEKAGMVGKSEGSKPRPWLG